jgi:hypothetical protein
MMVLRAGERGALTDPKRGRLDPPVSTDRRRGRVPKGQILPDRWEAIASGDDGLADFDLLRHRRATAILCAFDLLELDGDYLRGEPIDVRKAALAKLLRRSTIGLEFNEHIDNEDAARAFAHACRLGFEGIVSKRKGSRYQSGRSHDWLKMKDPNAPAAHRELSEDWSK